MSNTILRSLLALVALVLLAVPALGASLNPNLEVRQTNAISPPFSRYVYICLICTEAQHLAIPDPPFGDPAWERARPKVQMFDGGSAVLPTPPPGVAPSLDLVPGIPGDDYVYVAQVLSASVLGFDPGSGEFTVVAQVQRSTQLKYLAGSVVHQLTNPSGDTFILFTFASDLLGTYDVLAEGGLASYTPIPAGWTYSSQTLTSNLKFYSGGQATVLATTSSASWQLLQNVPEPGLAVLFGAAGLGLAVARRRR